MRWDIVEAVAGALAAGAVIVTVIYLAIQVKRNTAAMFSQTYQFATSALGEMAAIVGSSKELSRVFVTGMAEPAKLDDAEFAQFAYLAISLFRRYENVFFQYQSGLIDDDFWTGHRDNLVWFFHRPGMQAMWAERRYGFSERFRTFLESCDPGDIRSPAARRV